MILDTIFIFIILSLTFRGFKRGFSQMLISFGVFILSVALSFAAFGKIGDSISNSKYFSKPYMSASQTIEKQFKNLENQTIENLPYIASVSKYINDNDKFSDSLTKNAIASTVTLPLIAMLYIAIRLLAFGLRFVVKGTTSLPIVHGMDCILGAFCGLLMSVLVFVVLFFLLCYVQFVPMFNFIKEQFDSSGFVLLINDFIL